ncbi:MAG: SHOCT domain-containing protein [Acidimicrobiia bacterium]
MMYWHGMGLWGWTMMIAFWVLVVVLIVWAVRSAARPGPTEDRGALRILDERLAKGEIAPDEYKERRAVLEGRR